MTRSFFFTTLMLTMPLGCTDLEGTEPGECRDHLDNDADGLYDCEDADCSGSPDCEEADVDADADSDSDTDTDADSDDDSGIRYIDSGEDTGGVIYDLEIDSVTYGYDSSEWSYEVDCRGWAEAATIAFHQDVSGYVWEEEHEMGNYDWDPAGAWDVWGITLPIVTDYTQQVDDENTLFAGDPATEATMTWMIQVWENGGVGDCVVWGADTSVFASYGCREIGF